MHPNGRNGQEQSWLLPDGTINSESSYGRLLIQRKKLMNDGDDQQSDPIVPPEWFRPTLDGSSLTILRLLAIGEVSQSQVRRRLGVPAEVNLAAALHPLLESWIFTLEHANVESGTNQLEPDTQSNLELQLALKLKVALLAADPTEEDYA